MASPSRSACAASRSASYWTRDARAQPRVRSLPPPCLVPRSRTCAIASLEQPEWLAAGEQHAIAGRGVRDLDLDELAALHALVVRVLVGDLALEDRGHLAGVAARDDAPRAAVERCPDLHVRMEVLVRHERD